MGIIIGLLAFFLVIAVLVHAKAILKTLVSIAWTGIQVTVVGLILLVVSINLLPLLVS